MFHRDDGKMKGADFVCRYALNYFLFRPMGTSNCDTVRSTGDD